MGGSGGGRKRYLLALYRTLRSTQFYVSSGEFILLKYIVLYDGAIPARWDYIVVIVIVIMFVTIIIVISSSFKRHLVFRRVRRISKSDYLLRHVCPYVLPQGTSRLPPEGFHEI